MRWLLVLAGLASCGRLHFGELGVGGNERDAAGGGDDDGPTGDANGVSDDATMAAAPIAFVQTEYGIAGASNNVSATFDFNVTVGDLIVVELDYDNPGSVTADSLTDAFGDAFTLGNRFEDLANNYQYLAYAIAGASGVCFVTAHITANATTHIAERLAEYGHVRTTSPLDALLSNSGTNGLAETLGFSPSQNGELFVVFGVFHGGGGAAEMGFTGRAVYGEGVIEDTLTAVAFYQGYEDFVTGTSWTMSAATFFPQ